MKYLKDKKFDQNLVERQNEINEVATNIFSKY